MTALGDSMNKLMPTTVIFSCLVSEYNLSGTVTRFPGTPQPPNFVSGIDPRGINYERRLFKTVTVAKKGGHYQEMVQK